MRFDIDLLALDHSKVASYTNRSSGDLHALCAKALAKAYENLDYVRRCFNFLFSYFEMYF